MSDWDDDEPTAVAGRNFGPNPTTITTNNDDDWGDETQTKDNEDAWNGGTGFGGKENGNRGNDFRGGQRYDRGGENVRIVNQQSASMPNNFDIASVEELINDLNLKNYVTPLAAKRLYKYLCEAFEVNVLLENKRIHEEKLLKKRVEFANIALASECRSMLLKKISDFWQNEYANVVQQQLWERELPELLPYHLSNSTDDAVLCMSKTANDSSAIRATCMETPGRPKATSTPQQRTSADSQNSCPISILALEEDEEQRPTTQLLPNLKKANTYSKEFRKRREPLKCRYLVPMEIKPLGAESAITANSIIYEGPCEWTLKFLKIYNNQNECVNQESIAVLRETYANKAIYVHTNSRSQLEDNTLGGIAGGTFSGSSLSSACPQRMRAADTTPTGESRSTDPVIGIMAPGSYQSATQSHPSGGVDISESSMAAQAAPLSTSAGRTTVQQQSFGQQHSAASDQFPLEFPPADMSTLDEGGLPSTDSSTPLSNQNSAVTLSTSDPKSTQDRRLISSSLTTPTGIIEGRRSLKDKSRSVVNRQILLTAITEEELPAPPADHSVEPDTPSTIAQGEKSGGPTVLPAVLEESTESQTAVSHNISFPAPVSVSRMYGSMRRTLHVEKGEEAAAAIDGNYRNWLEILRARNENMTYGGQQSVAQPTGRRRRRHHVNRPIWQIRRRSADGTQEQHAGTQVDAPVADAAQHVFAAIKLAAKEQQTNVVSSQLEQSIIVADAGTNDATNGRANHGVSDAGAELVMVTAISDIMQTSADAHTVGPAGAAAGAAASIIAVNGHHVAGATIEAGVRRFNNRRGGGDDEERGAVGGFGGERYNGGGGFGGEGYNGAGGGGGGRKFGEGGGRKFGDDNGQKRTRDAFNDGNNNRVDEFGPDGEPQKPREFYIPPEPTNDESELFSTGITTGINFSKYENIPVKVSGENVPPRIKSFDEADLREIILENVKKSGYSIPTPIQKVAIPVIAASRDLMACAQTGSGKTAAFLLPILSSILEKGKELHVGRPHAVIISPTRELAVQIYNEARKFAFRSYLKISIVYGGTSFKHQNENVAKGCHILIATPGRLLDFVNRTFITFEDTRFVVLDEADRMLDMGFLENVKTIMKHLTMNPERQTLMFSATFPEDIQRLAGDFLDNYVFITIGVVGGACTDVKQDVFEVNKFNKRSKLLELLRDSADGTIVFVETKRGADFLASFFSETEFPTTSIHGDRLQSQREMALRDFKNGKMKVLIATSVASRGLDIKNVQHVINYDMPTSIDDYVHRIGRTGRVGNRGRATSFFDPNTDGAITNDLIKILEGANQEVPSFLRQLGSGGGGDGCFQGSGFGGVDVRANDGISGALEEDQDWD